MGKFEYMSISEDAFGRVLYKCKCAMCGNDCIYGRKVDTEPLCKSCKTKKYNTDMWKREKLKPLDELVKAVKGYQASYDKMPSMNVFDEFVDIIRSEIVQGDLHG